MAPGSKDVPNARHELGHTRLGDCLPHGISIDDCKKLVTVNFLVEARATNNCMRLLEKNVRLKFTRPIGPETDTAEYLFHKSNRFQDTKSYDWLEEHRNARSPGRREILEHVHQIIAQVKDIRRAAHFGKISKLKLHQRAQRAKANEAAAATEAKAEAEEA